MNILTISLGRHILERGSRERERMHTYAKHLDAYHIVVLTRKEHGYSEAQHEGSLHVYPTNSSSRLMMLWDAFIISRAILKAASPCTISAQDPLEIGWLCFILSKHSGAKLHVQVHGDYFSSNGWVGYSLVRRLRRRIALSFLRYAPRIRVVSERIKRSLAIRGVPEDRITVLPIRSELEVFLKSEHIVRDTEPYTFLYIGRLAPEKDIARIVRAFALLHQTHPTAILRIVGSGSEKSAIEALIKHLKLAETVQLTSWTEHVADEMSRADVFLLASKHEAYALTLIEAMAVGLPIITTDVGCVGEVVKDGVHGIVVSAHDVRSYAEAMQRMIDDVDFRKKSGEAGKQTAMHLAEMTADSYAEAWVTAILGSK